MYQRATLCIVVKSSGLTYLQLFATGQRLDGVRLKRTLTSFRDYGGLNYHRNFKSPHRNFLFNSLVAIALLAFKLKL